MRPPPVAVSPEGLLRRRAWRGRSREFWRGRASDEDIGGLDVAMDDAFGVSGVERVGNVDADFEEAIDFERRAGDDVLERRAFHEFHDDEGAAVVFLNVVDRADVGMVQRGGGAGFALKAFECLRIVGDVIGKKFEGDEAAELGVFGFVDDAHSAAAEFFDDAVMRDGLSDQGGGIGHRGDSMGAVSGRVKCLKGKMGRRGDGWLPDISKNRTL